MTRRQQIQQLRKQLVQLDVEAQLYSAILNCAIRLAGSGKDSQPFVERSDEYQRRCEEKLAACEAIAGQIDRLEYECTWAYAWQWLWRKFCP